MALRRRLLTDRAALTSLGFVSRARLLLMQKTQLCKKKKKIGVYLNILLCIFYPTSISLYVGAKTRLICPGIRHNSWVPNSFSSINVAFQGNSKGC